jgi:hypothetical protein
MRSIFSALSLPGFAGPKTYAAWPVWTGSTTKEIKFRSLSKKAATRLWHRARDFDRQSRRQGCHGGALGHAALQVLHTLIFDFLNYGTGRLDPSHAAIARKANVCERTVRNALNRLRDLGILAWIRRCTEGWRAGRFVREQETNAYALQPPSGWRGYREPPEAPAPAPGTWGCHLPLPDVVTQAAADRRAGGTLQGTIRTLGGDPGNALAAALARLGAAIERRDPQ